MIEKLTVPFEIKEIDQTDDNFTFEGHLAVFNNVDLGGDKIIPGAFADFLKESKKEKLESIPIFWVHDSHEPVGVFLINDMEEVKKGLFVKGLMPRSDTFVSGRVIPQMKIGSVGQMSIGYEAKDWKYEDNVRILEKIHLHEGSLVSLAMNPEATITAMKKVYDNLPLDDRSRAWNAGTAKSRIRSWAGADDGLDTNTIRSKYRKAFLWYDSEDAENFGAYKLPFADVINGTLTAIPRGVFAAAAAMQGARGGVNVPNGDKPGIVVNINKYYKKMGLESPFGKSFRLDDLSATDERLLESLLKQGVRFTNSMAPAIVSAIKSAGLRDEVTSGLRDEEKVAIVNEINDILKRIGGNKDA